MPAPAPFDLAATAVLRLGGAVAVLVETAATSRGGRDAAAAAALTRVTGLGGIAISRRASGRPRLAPPYPELAVSLSVRPPFLLAGFAPAAPVGVDIERIDAVALTEPARLARDHLAAAEADAVDARAGDVDAQRELFLRLWVAKEAALKVTGRGVYDGMTRPDLAGQLAALVQDGALVRTALAEGRIALSVRRVETTSGPHLCALAVGEA